MDRHYILMQLSDRSTYPAEAVNYCLDHPDRTISIFYPLLRKASQGSPLEPEEQNALYLGLHLLASLRVKDAFEPLLDLALLQPEKLVDIFGENGIGTTFPRILMSLCDGEGTRLWQTIPARQIDFLIRDAFLRAWTFEVFEGRVSHAMAIQHLAHLLDQDVAPLPDDPIWSGWLTAIADLGFRDLKPLVRDAIHKGYILTETAALAEVEFQSFETALQEADAIEDRSTLQKDRNYLPFSEAPGDWGQAFVNAPT
ncbi:MAG: DUF1186 domain-containing protein [Roseibium sp.]